MPAPSLRVRRIRIQWSHIRRHQTRLFLNGDISRRSNANQATEILPPERGSVVDVCGNIYRDADKRCMGAHDNINRFYVVAESSSTLYIDWSHTQWPR